MKNKRLYLKLKTHLLKRGINVKWWVKTYLPNIHYNTAMAQFHDNNEMTDYVKDGIKTYLEKQNV